MQVYELTVAKGGPRIIVPNTTPKAREMITLSNGSVVAAPGYGAPPISGLQVWKEGDDISGEGFGPTSLGGKKKSMAALASKLAWLTERPVLDRTGLAGEFNWYFEFAPVDRFADKVRLPPGVTAWPTRAMFKALEEDLGLELKPTKEKVEVLVIDRVERPSEN